MNIQSMRSALFSNIRTFLVALVICTAVPVSALADAPTSPTCNALVSIANNLYLVNSTGKVLTQFTADGAAKDNVSLSPDGKRVAYAIQQDNEDTYEVADIYGRHGFFPVYMSRSRSGASNFDSEYADAPLMDLSWMSNDVLRLTKHISPYSARFEFRRIPVDLGRPARVAAPVAFSINCVANPYGERIACIEPEGKVYLGGSISSHADDIFDVTGFEGIAPEQTLTARVGQSIGTQGTPSFVITIESIVKNEVTLKITPPDGIWEMPMITSGSYMTISYSTSNSSSDAYLYGFIVKIIDPNAGLVQVVVVKSDNGPDLFDQALAWTPDGHGLLIIRRTKTQSWLYLIRPRDGNHQWGGRDQQANKWALVAKAPINLPEVLSMRFATPSLLLLQGDLESFNEVPIRISRDQGHETLTLGTVVALPSALTVQINGASTQGAVLGWSCKARLGVGTGGR